MAKKIEILENTLLKLLVRRGTNQDRKAITLSEGELGYTTDTNRLYVGDGSTEGGVLVGNKFLGQDNEITTFTDANIGDLAYDSNDRALYAYMGPGPASAIENWQLISSVTDEGTGNINVGINQIRPDAAGAGIVVTGGQLAIDCNGIKTNKVEACAGVMQLPNKIQFGAGGSSYEYTLPARTNSAGKFLVGDNNGNLSWSNDVASDVITYFNSNDVPVPVGTIAPFASLDAVMNNWVICDGSSKSTTAYPDLFDVIGYNYGGSGGTFNVPNLINKTIYGTSADPSGELEYGLGGEGQVSYRGGLLRYGEINIGDIASNWNNEPLVATGDFSSAAGYKGPDNSNTIAVTFDTPLSDTNYTVAVEYVPLDPNNPNVLRNNSLPQPLVFNKTVNGFQFNVEEIYGEQQSIKFNVRVESTENAAGGTGLSNAGDILNIYGGFREANGGIVNDPGPNRWGTTEETPIPAGQYLVNVKFQENNSGDEDIVRTLSEKFNVPTGNYLWFATKGNVAYYTITTAATPPVDGDSSWINIGTLAGADSLGSGINPIANIHGFAIKLDATETTGTAPIDAKAMVYAIKAVGDPIVDSSMTVRSPLTAAVDGVQQGENPFNPLSNNIEIGMPVVEVDTGFAGNWYTLNGGTHSLSNTVTNDDKTYNIADFTSSDAGFDPSKIRMLYVKIFTSANTNQYIRATYPDGNLYYIARTAGNPGQYAGSVEQVTPIPIGQNQTTFRIILDSSSATWQIIGAQC